MTVDEWDQILDSIFEKRGDTWTIEYIRKQTGLSLSLISPAVSVLEEDGLITVIPENCHMRFNPSHPRARELFKAHEQRVKRAEQIPHHVFGQYADRWIN